MAPSTDTPVPLCYGYHPYLTVPGVPREEWVLQTPAMRRLPTDDRGIPTGERRRARAAKRPAFFIGHRAGTRVGKRTGQCARILSRQGEGQSYRT